jgi:hypothetical protein
MLAEITVLEEYADSTQVFSHRGEDFYDFGRPFKALSSVKNIGRDVIGVPFADNSFFIRYN